MKGTALLVVRAVVAKPEDKASFDLWYQDEHLPEAAATLRASRAWRGWSAHEPLTHYAYYMMPDVETARAAIESPAFKTVIQTFSDAWGERVSRTRDLLEVEQLIA